MKIFYEAVLFEITAKNPIRFFRFSVTFRAIAFRFAFLHFQIRAAEREKFPIAGFLAEAFFAFDHRNHGFGKNAVNRLIFFTNDY